MSLDAYREQNGAGNAVVWPPHNEPDVKPGRAGGARKGLQAGK